MDIYPPTVQRSALLKFAEALNSASNAFRRDECGDPRINGSRGHAYAALVGGKPGFQLYCICESKQAWTWAKKLMTFAKVTQDGDEEGILFLDRLPTATEAEIIRSYLGIRPKPEVNAQEAERRRQRGEHLAKKPPRTTGEAESIPGRARGRPGDSPRVVDRRFRLAGETDSHATESLMNGAQVVYLLMFVVTMIMVYVMYHY